MLKRCDDLIINRGLIPANINCSSPQIAADNAAFIATLIADGGVLPQHPSFEIHPYLNEFPLQNYEKYIIGTFPPISYILDNQLISAHGINFLQQPPGVGGNAITKPGIPFFHGNMGNMWNYLLTNDAPNFELNTLNDFLPLNRIEAKNYLINFLHGSKINYSDIIRSAQRSAYNANDTGLHNICINNDLICHILNNENAKEILFNTGSPFGVGGLQIHQNVNANGAQGMVNVRETNAFDLFVRGCQEMGLKVEVRINAGLTPHFDWVEINFLNTVFLNINLSNKLIFEMKISGKIDSTDCKYSGVREYTVITGPSPSNAALMGVPRNANFIAWDAVQPAGMGGVPNFIKYIYQTFRGNVAPLYDLNI